MKRLVLALALLSGFAVMSFADANFDSVTNDMSGVMVSVSSNISTEMAKHMGFLTGDGNIYPVNTSGFLGLKLGIGFGINTTPLFWKIVANPTNADILTSSSSSNAASFDSIAKVFGAIPLPYDQFYIKIGLPVLPMDVGIRLGFIPGMNLPIDSNNNVAVGQFHFGVEARYVLWELAGGLLKVDARLSYDYDGGSIAITNNNDSKAYDTSSTLVGSNSTKIGMSYVWNGNSIGAKVMAGLNLPVIGSIIYGGLGLNVNIGGVTTTLGAAGKFMSAQPDQTFSISGLKLMPYSAMDMRLIGGFNILFINAAVEYNLFNGDLAINFFPFSMSF